MKKLHRIITLFTLSILLFACVTRSKYASTDKIYKDQAKILAETIAKIPEPKPDLVSPKITQQGIDIPQEWVGTVNFNLRKPNLVVLHYTAQDSVEQTIQTFTNSRTQVSAHYVIAKDGKVIQMLNDYLRAWHAGVGKWGNQTDVNSNSIGIEMDNNGTEKFSDAQIQSLVVLLDTLKQRYNIPQANFIGHSDVAPSRKIDPGKFFPWKLLAEKGFGYWYDEANIEKYTAPENFDVKMALRIIGYDTKNYNYAVQAFKQRFFPENDSKLTTFDARQCALLYQLYLKHL